MNEIEQKIAARLLSRVEERCDQERIAAYANFLEAVKLRIEIDKKFNPSGASSQ